MKTGRRPAASDAVTVARREFLAGGRVEIGAIADELSINRATLHRWFGTRDRLLGEVLWSLASDTLDGARERARGTGRARLLNTLSLFLGDMVVFPAFRRFLDHEPEAAARVLMTTSGDVERRVVDAVEALLREEPELVTRLSVPPATLAFAIVRVGEAFLYADVIADGQPDVQKALGVFELLLPERAGP